MADRPAEWGVARNVNPEAGWHAVSLDPLEQEAAAAATARSWEDFPYYSRRYGKRGWRFSLSDSGWLQTLGELSIEAARQQSRWLAGLLAARGMPSLLLERHLGHLHGELTARGSELATRHARLVNCQAALRDTRLAHLPATGWTPLADAFDERAARAADPVPRMGLVLVAAVVDDAAGFDRALGSMLDWAMDPGQFDDIWRAAVDATVSATRAQLTRA